MLNLSSSQASDVIIEITQIEPLASGYVENRKFVNALHMVKLFVTVPLTILNRGGFNRFFVPK